MKKDLFNIMSVLYQTKPYYFGLLKKTSEIMNSKYNCSSFYVRDRLRQRRSIALFVLNLQSDHFSPA